MSKLSVTFVLLAVFSSSCFAQSSVLKSEAQTQALSKKVVNLFYEDKVSEAFAQIYPYWPLPEKEIAEMETKTKDYMSLLTERFGKKIGVTKLKDEKSADVGLRETYLVRYERNAIRMMFTYYKGSDGWIINSFKWDDSFSLTFE